MIVETMNSATQRRELRSKLRHAIGVSSDPAPDARRAIRAATYAAKIVSLATNGVFQLRIERAGEPTTFEAASEEVSR